LEDRTVPSNFTAATVSDLIADINAANLAGGSNAIALVAGNTYGGDGLGGGIYNQGTLTLIQSTINGNKSNGGAGGSGGSGGTDGLGKGGGVCNIGTISIDALTAIFGNTADAFSDCFGC
jgi:hypothetical protein